MLYTSLGEIVSRKFKGLPVYLKKHITSLMITHVFVLDISTLGGGFIFLYKCSPLLGEDSHFDIFSNWVETTKTVPKTSRREEDDCAEMFDVGTAVANPYVCDAWIQS